jgi:hypothetical protein
LKGLSQTANADYRNKIYNYQLTYTEILSKSKTQKLTIECSYWRNPVTPVPVTGLVLESFDYNDNLIDVSDSFSVTAAGGAAYTPAPITEDAVTYSVSADPGATKARI